MMCKTDGGRPGTDGGRTRRLQDLLMSGGSLRGFLLDGRWTGETVSDFAIWIFREDLEPAIGLEPMTC